MNNFDGEHFTIAKDVCKFYHDSLEHYMHIYTPEYSYTTDEVHAMSILHALVSLLGQPLIDRHHDPVIHPVQLELKLDTKTK